MTLSEKFSWYFRDESASLKTPEERYCYITEWALRARNTNPGVFDELTEWILKSGEWSESEIRENEKYFFGIIKCFSEQNKVLRAELTELVPYGVVNASVFDALNRFDDELTGNTHVDCLKETVARVFGDFTALYDPEIRAEFAGGKTGAEGVNSVDIFGYINFLKDCDASVQWTLFMPGLTESQQLENGIKVESFEYIRLPAIRFIGLEKDMSENVGELHDLIRTLDSMYKYCCGFDHDMILFHHFGKGVDVERCHGVWGRFFKQDTPVPEGMTHIDFIIKHNGITGAPYISQFAFAKFSGDTDSMHRQEGFDSDAMYDITRNIILGQNVAIPYPNKYWTAEVYLDGFGRDSTAYLFSTEK